jgi:hypothetical protein
MRNKKIKYLIIILKLNIQILLILKQNIFLLLSWMNNKNNKNKNNISSYEISKINNYTYNFFIKDEEYRNILYSSILLLLQHAFHNKIRSSIFITCEKINLLSEYLLENDGLLTYEQILNIIYTLSIQINFLYEKKYGFYGIDLDDVIVVNDDIFIIINNQKLLKLDKHDDENELLIINKMIHIPFFHNPEILKIQELPAKINHKCIYYSLALLIIYCMFGKSTFENKKENENENKKENENENENENEKEKEKEININESIKSIYSTKLYFFLERCLNNLDERCLLFV